MLKKAVFLYLWAGACFAYGQIGPVPDGKPINPNETLLSSKNGKEASAIVNSYTGKPGCYILCIGPQGKGLYSIGRTYDLHGLIRIDGEYPTQRPTGDRSKRYCYPDGVKGEASYFTYYKKLCDNTFSTCGKLCNGNGDTGSFFTNPPIK